MSDLRVLVGRRIRQMRKDKGLTQAGLSEMISTSDTYLASIERGERNLSIENLERITNALGAEPIDAFRFGELEMVEGLEGKRTAIRLLTALLEERSQEEIELVQRMAKDVLSVIDLEKRRAK